MNEKEILVARANEEVNFPTKTNENGCYDLYANFDDYEIMIPAHTTKLIPTNLCSAYSEKYRISIRERGSNTKSNLIVMAGQMDSGFRGMWFVALHNSNDVPVEITKGVDEVEKTEDFIRVPYSKAVAQFAVEFVPDVTLKELSVEEILSIPSDRGTGMLGSSNK